MFDPSGLGLISISRGLVRTLAVASRRADPVGKISVDGYVRSLSSFALRWVSMNFVCVLQSRQASVEVHERGMDFLSEALRCRESVGEDVAGV